MPAFRSLRNRIIQPLLLLSAIAGLSGILGAYFLASNALQQNLYQRGQLLSTTLVISAETSSSLADFHRAVLAIASEPSIHRIMLLTTDYQPIFNGDIFEFNSYKNESEQLDKLVLEARKTGLSIGSVDFNDDNIYHVVSLIHISALPQGNVLNPEASLLLISLNTEQARTDALFGAIWVTALFISIGLIAFIAIFFLLNKLVLKPSQRIVQVMKFQRLKKDETTGFTPNHELGLIGQTFDQLAQTLNAREKSLNQALIEAQEANLAKSQFLASMSHEIRTPMNGVTGMLHLLSQEPLSDKQHHYIEMARSSSGSLLSLINDILDVSKIEAGKLDIENIDFDICQLFKDICATMSHRIESKELELVLELQDIDNQFVQGDPGRIRQILTNLIGNAIKFTQQGRIIIRAALKKTDNVHGNEINNLQLRCDIIDTGIGISDDKLGQLFESFTQADSSTTREYGGTGLGLTIVKQLCQLMGGDVEAISKLGQGSQFSFYINLKYGNEQNNPSTKNSDTENLDNILNKNKRLRILLVEDNSINQLVALGMLENLGIDADAAKDGQVAIDTLLQKPDEYYSLIFMDCQMPVMDGFTASRNIRNGDAGENYSDIPIIAMTANAMRGDRERCINAGMIDYLAKPIDQKLLVACLSTWLPTENNISKIDKQNNTITDFVAKEIANNIWDRQALLQRLGNNEQLMSKILQSFLEDMPNLISKIKLHIKNKNSSDLEEILHTIKGVTANISATELHNLSVKTELQCKNNLWPEIEISWSEFQAAYQNLSLKIVAASNKN
jgi:signal transduction histidine kinase/CheY-like chemotaxis protein/HPt (histidine-containing phosphotransfer) domain-containing protein